jgi:hypothetical protein
MLQLMAIRITDATVMVINCNTIHSLFVENLHLTYLTGKLTTVGFFSTKNMFFVNLYNKSYIM